MTKPLIGIVLVLLATARGSALSQPTDLEDYTVFGEEKVTFGSAVVVKDGAVGSNGLISMARRAFT